VTERLLKGINRQTADEPGMSSDNCNVPHINYTITKMEFTSINVRMLEYVVVYGY